MVLSEIDKLILNSYKTIVYGLADYLGPESEVVLHSLENYESSAIIIAGENTKRKVGAPITDLALNMLSRISVSEETNFLTYFTKSKSQTKMKSSTIAIYGENKRIIGLLCINYNLECKLDDFIKNFSYPEKADEDVNLINFNSSEKSSMVENFTNSIDELIEEKVEKIKIKIDNNEEISNNNKNKEIIKILYEEGIFNIKDGVIRVAKKMNISKNTVYLHIRQLEKNKKLWINSK